jgi:hypothetical protein
LATSVSPSVSLTSAYTDLTGVNTEVITSVNEYFTYLVSVNDKGGVNVNSTDSMDGISLARVFVTDMSNGPFDGLPVNDGSTFIRYKLDCDGYRDNNK